MPVDADLPAYRDGRSSTYHLTARGVRTFVVAFRRHPPRVVNVAPDRSDGFRLVERHWVGPDLGYLPGGGA
jgi:hypothetical protein